MNRPGGAVARWALRITLAAAVTAGGAAFAADPDRPVTTDAQAAWLQRQGALRALPERDYGPFVFVDEAGRVTGLSVEMLELVQRRTGIVFDWLPARPLEEQLGLLRRHEADLVTSLRQTPERSAFLLFTRPYIKVPAILLVRADERADGLASFRQRRVAVGAGYAVESVIRASYPEVDWQRVSDDAAALRGVAERRFDAAVVDAASAAFLIRRQGIGGLASAGEVGFDYDLSFAVRGDWPELRAILDAGIAAVPAAERDALVQRWLGPLDAGAMAERAPLATRVGILLVLFAVLAGAVVLAQRMRVRPVGPRPRGRRGRR